MNKSYVDSDPFLTVLIDENLTSFQRRLCESLGIQTEWMFIIGLN